MTDEDFEGFRSNFIEVAQRRRPELAERLEASAAEAEARADMHVRDQRPGIAA